MICPFVYTLRLTSIPVLYVLALGWVIFDTTKEAAKSFWSDFKELNHDAFESFKDALKGEAVYS